MSRIQLEKIGFRRLTRWEIRGDKLKPADISLPGSRGGGCLYAFVIDRAVKYVGLTGGALISRMDHYSYGPHDTNERIRENIREAIRANKSVAIFGRFGIPPGELKREEERLICELRPDWNRT